MAASPSFRRDYEQEDDHNPPSKKSVLAKVREKAKKWKQTLVKKKHDNDDNATPAWGVNLEDENEEEEDPEYLGAPSKTSSEAFLCLYFLAFKQLHFSINCLLLHIIKCMNQSWHLRATRRLQGSIRERFP